MTLFTRYPRLELENVVVMARLLADDLAQPRAAAARLSQFAANVAPIDGEFASIAAKLPTVTAEQVELAIDTEAYFAARAAAANLMRLLPIACAAGDDDERAQAQAAIEAMIDTMTVIAHLDEAPEVVTDDIIADDSDEE